jgi:tetratricopeptide (TPR) repeat protein
METTGAKVRESIRRILAPYEKLARAFPRDPDAIYALAAQLVLWADGRKTPLVSAERLVRRALALAPDRASLHALLGRIQDDLGRLDAALASYERAVALKPDDLDYANCLVLALSQSDAELAFKRLLALTALRHGFDLTKTRQDLRAAGMPADDRTVYLNAFPSARNYFTSRLWDEAEAFERRRLKSGYRQRKRQERQRALASRRKNRLLPGRVPVEFRPLLPLARKWGVGDDADRGLLLSRITPAQKRELKRALPVRARRRITAWLDGFATGRMPREAAAFMYLLEAFDELG